MSIKHKKLFIFTILFVFYAVVAHAESVVFLFVSPGSEGDSHAAQPYLDAFLSELGQKTGIELKGKYVNDSKQAIAQIDQAGIVLASPSFVHDHASTLKGKLIARALPAYSHLPKEEYFIFSSKNELKKNRMLLSSQKYSASFLKNILSQSSRPELLGINQVTETETMLDDMQAIADGTLDAMVFLSGYEYSVLKKMKMPILGSLNLLATVSVPASGIYVNEAIISPELVGRIKNVLGELKQKNYLRDLRLSGFSIQ